MPADTAVTAVPAPGIAAPSKQELRVEKAGFQLEVLEFHDLLAEHRVTKFKIRYVVKSRCIELNAGRFRKDIFSPEPTTIQVNCRDSLIRLQITSGRRGPIRYYPVGITFERADETLPIGQPWSTDAKRLLDAPFHSVKMNEPAGTIEFTNTATRVKRDNPKFNQDGTHRTYRFSVFIQDADTGKIGVIDPEIENVNAY